MFCPKCGYPLLLKEYERGQISLVVVHNKDVKIGLLKKGLFALASWILVF